MNTAVKNVLAKPVIAKLIRFTPTAWKDYKSLRVELYGVDFKKGTFNFYEICYLVIMPKVNINK